MFDNSAAVECSLRHLRNCCFSSIACRRLKIVDNSCDVFAALCQLWTCEVLVWTDYVILNCEHWTVTFLIISVQLWHCLCDCILFYCTRWISSMHQASCSFTCDRNKPKVVKCACELQCKPLINSNSNRTWTITVTEQNTTRTFIFGSIHNSC